MPDERALQNIRDLFDHSKTSEELGEAVWGDLFGMADKDATLAFLGAVFKAVDDEAVAWSLLMVLKAAYMRTDAGFEALQGHIKRLLSPPQRKARRKR